jgi:hypothetical protein
MQRRNLCLLMFAWIPLAACGGGSTPTNPTVTPIRAVIQATGNGALVVHPSLDPSLAFALETPLEIRETAGGAVDWTFARFALFQDGVEIEGGELGTSAIQAAGFGRINPNTTINPVLVFRFGATQFNGVSFTLGFTDINLGESFVRDVPLRVFTGVDQSATPLSNPGGQVRQQ